MSREDGEGLMLSKSGGLKSFMEKNEEIIRLDNDMLLMDNDMWQNESG